MTAVGAWWQNGAQRSVQAVVDRFAGPACVPFAVEMPDGTRCLSGPGSPAFTLVFRTDAALVSTFARGHIGLLEAWFDQEIDLPI